MVNHSPSFVIWDETRLDQFQRVRDRTVSLIEGLSDADCTVQSMADASPAKWHLAHTTWFWEEFLLCGHFGQDQRFHPQFRYLFNSYYNAIGDRPLRSDRGLLTRPTLKTVLEFRQAIDERVHRTLANIEGDEPVWGLVALGLAHEEQHQELLLTDILHLFAQNPLKPVYRPMLRTRADTGTVTQPGWSYFDPGGVVLIGHNTDQFAFDCEGPAHNVLLQPFALADRLVTNGEWISFIEDGGYENPRLWLSDGWAVRQEEGWHAPLYWDMADNQWHSMTLNGYLPIDLTAPVCHISFYEADAFASWASHQSGERIRLPLETEWEWVARSQTAQPADRQLTPLRPMPQTGSALSGLYTDVWEWTASPFTPYPGFAPAKGAVGEYNGKFMNGQRVLRGASCATPKGHSRPTYRNFFQPEKRWQFSGLRLAKTI